MSQHQISSVAVNPTGEWLAFGCRDVGQLLVWEWQSESYVLKQQGHFYDMSSLSHSPDGSVIATGGDDGKVKLWNTSSGFCFVTFSEHSSAVSDVVFSASGKVVVSASLDGTVRAFDLHRCVCGCVCVCRVQFLVLQVSQLSHVCLAPPRPIFLFDP